MVRHTQTSSDTQSSIEKTGAGSIESNVLGNSLRL